MMSGLLSERKRVLEEAFFQREAFQAIERVRLSKDREAQLAEMAKVSGATDRKLLERILDLGIDAKTFWAVTLTPLVEVAWADGSISEQERSSLLQAAEGRGVKKGSPAHTLLEKWLDLRPDPQLMEAWVGYVSEVSKSLRAEELARFKARVLGEAQAVAEAAGGLLGMGAKISEKERMVLQEMSSAFPQ